MPDTAMRNALRDQPGLLARIAELEQLVADLKTELRIALPLTSAAYTTQGHYYRVMLRYLTEESKQ